MPADEALDALARFIRDGGRLVILAGAGISIPAGIPGGRAVVQRLKDAYPAAFDPLRDYDYVEAFDAALPGEAHREKRRIFFEELCAGIPAAEEHDWIAHLVDAGAVRAVVTTNFDHLTDFAMMARCRRPLRIFMFEDELDPEIVAVAPALIKLHGDFLFDDLANLPLEMQQRLDRNMHDKLRACLKDAALLVLGYSGSDESVMHFLRGLAGEAGVMTSVWWNIFAASDQTAAVEEIVTAARDAGKTAEIIGPMPALEILQGLGSRLGIEPPQPVPFGVNPGIENPRRAFAHRFVARRHRPPALQHELSEDQRRLLHELSAAMALDGWTWVAESAALDDVVAALATNGAPLFDTRRALVPRDQALLDQFVIHDDLRDPTAIADSNATETMAAVIRAGAPVFVMHPFRDPQDEMSDMFARVLVALARAGSGHVVVIEQSQPDGWLDELRQRAQAIDPDAVIPPPRLLRGPAAADDPAPPHADILVLLAALRFAPSVDFFVSIRNDAAAALAELESKGIVRIERDAIVLGERVRNAFRGRATKDDHRALAAALQHAATTEAQHVGGSLLIEAEHHCFEAGDYEKAFRLLSKFQFGDSAALYGCKRLVAWSPVLTEEPVRLALKPEDAVAMIHFCQMAIGLARRPVPHADEAAQAIAQTLHAGLPPVWQELLETELNPYDDDCYPRLRSAYLLAKSIGDTAAYFRGMKGLSSYWVGTLTRPAVARRDARRALLFAREVVKRAVSAGDHDTARSYRDHEGIALGALGMADERREVARAQVREVARGEGLSYAKGVVYGNQFFSELADGAWKKASGLLPESQLNFWYGNHLLGIVVNLAALWETSLQRPEVSALPRPHDTCSMVIRIVTGGSCDDDAVMERVEPMLCWRVDDACTAGGMTAATAAIADWALVRDATPRRSNESSAFLAFYQWLGVVYFSFGGDVVESLIEVTAADRRHARSHEVFIALLRDPRTNVEWPARLYFHDWQRPAIMRQARADAEAFVASRRR